VRERKVTAAIGGQPQEGTGARVHSVELGIGHAGDDSHVFIILIGALAP
jgi:hypothetical protein